MHAHPHIHSDMQASSRQQQEQEKLIKEYELRQKAKSVVVPTDDGKVRQMLRQLGEPITLFGEKEVRALMVILYCMMPHVKLDWLTSSLPSGQYASLGLYIITYTCPKTHRKHTHRNQPCHALVAAEDCSIPLHSASP